MSHNHQDRFSPHIIIITAIFFISILETVGTVFYMAAEGWGFIDALYFTTTTLTTIGFGDHVPTMPHTKLFTIFFALAGVGTVLFYVTLVSNHYFRRKMWQISHLEHRIHKMLTPEEIRHEEKEIQEEKSRLEDREKRLFKEKAKLQEKKKMVEEEAEEVQEKKEKIKEIARQI